MPELDHEHQFTTARPGSVLMCLDGDCTAIRVYCGRHKYRTLTPTEMVDVLAIQMQDIAIAQAMTLIHGEERGMQRAREVLGYD